MSEFTIRSESVDVDQIMKQIRQRILEKRGADYTEDQIRELASVRLEKFLDPKSLRSDLLDQFRKSRPAAIAEPPVITPPHASEQTDFLRRTAALCASPQAVQPAAEIAVQPEHAAPVLHTQAQFNVDLPSARRAARSSSIARARNGTRYYEVLHNLVLETTRMGIEVQNLRMKTESLSSRLDFSERVRAPRRRRAIRPEAVRSPNAGTKAITRRRSRRRPISSKASCPRDAAGQAMAVDASAGAAARPPWRNQVPRAPMGAQAQGGGRRTPRLMKPAKTAVTKATNLKTATRVPPLRDSNELAGTRPRKDSAFRNQSKNLRMHRHRGTSGPQGTEEDDQREGRDRRSAHWRRHQRRPEQHARVLRAPRQTWRSRC
jgi:hypothetical protein